MINRVFAVSIAAMLGPATLPVGVSARGFASHGFHHGFAHRPYDSIVPGYVIGDATYAGYALGDQRYSAAALPAQFRDVPSPAPAPSCHHSRETVTVPAEEGGSREITITRC